MKLLIIRHAESSNNRIALNLDYEAYMRTRSDDPVITDLGVEQARLLAQHMTGAPPADAPAGAKGHYGITHLYVSPMLRAIQTAAPVAAALGMQPELWPDIHEHGGIFMGNPRAGDGLIVRHGLRRPDIRRDFPDFVVTDAITDDGWWYGGYEDLPGCYARAIRVARDLRRRAEQEAEQHTETCVAIVSHGTFIDSMLKAFLPQLPDRGLPYFHNNTGMTCLDFGHNGTLYLRYLNRTAHLPADMVSE